MLGIQAPHCIKWTAQTFEYRKNERHLVFLCAGLVFKWSVHYIGYRIDQPFEYLTIWNSVFKWSVFRSPMYTEHVWYLDPTWRAFVSGYLIVIGWSRRRPGEKNFFRLLNQLEKHHIHLFRAKVDSTSSCQVTVTLLIQNWLLCISTSERMLAHAFTLSKTIKNATNCQKSTFFIVPMRNSGKAHARTWSFLLFSTMWTHACTCVRWLKYADNNIALFNECCPM